jgi:hypothetical protein
MLLVQKKTPDSIRNHRYSWLFAPEWQMVHNRMEGNSFTFFIGMNGSGKTYADLKRSEIMGVNEQGDNSFLFDWDNLGNHVFWDKNVMLEKIHELEKNYSHGKIRGYQLILDEAQKSANAKEWNDREVLAFSKEMTTIRSSRLNISLTMPTYRMITTDLRQLGTYQAEMLPPDTMDRVNGYSFCKLHLLELKPFISEVWRKRPYLHMKQLNPVTGLVTVHQGLLSKFRWELPNRTIRRNYESLKKDFRRQFAEERVAAGLELAETKKKKLGFKEMIDLVKKNIGNYVDKDNNVLAGLIAADGVCGLDAAKYIAKALNKSN